MWNFNIQVDKFIEARRPNIIFVRKKKTECVIIDIAVPGDIRTQMKEDEKIEKYEDLRWEISKPWGVQTTIIPITIGALGAIITDRLTSYLAMVGVSLSFETTQKSALLESAHILRRKVLVAEINKEWWCKDLRMDKETSGLWKRPGSRPIIINRLRRNNLGSTNCTWFARNYSVV